MSYLASQIKTVQRGTIAYLAGATSATATLFIAVDTTKAALFFLGEVVGNEGLTAGVINQSRLDFTSATVITAIRQSGTSSGGIAITGTVYFQVVEYK